MVTTASKLKERSVLKNNNYLIETEVVQEDKTFVGVVNKCDVSLTALVEQAKATERLKIRCLLYTSNYIWNQDVRFLLHVISR